MILVDGKDENGNAAKIEYQVSCLRVEEIRAAQS